MINRALLSGFVLSENLTNMGTVFKNCTGLINLSGLVIPTKVTNMIGTFYGCTNLGGEIEINVTNLTSYSNCFKNTVQPITITGSCSDATKANLAATANNGNVTY